MRCAAVPGQIECRRRGGSDCLCSFAWDQSGELYPRMVVSAHTYSCTCTSPLGRRALTHTPVYRTFGRLACFGILSILLIELFHMVTFPPIVLEQVSVPRQPLFSAPGPLPASGSTDVSPREVGTGGWSISLASGP